MISYVAAGFALSMDAFAVSVTSAVCNPRMRLAGALRIAFAFGFFQFLMPLVGYAAGTAFAPVIEPVDHWIAFVLLAAVGGKMLVESMRRPAPQDGACLELVGDAADDRMTASRGPGGGVGTAYVLSGPRLITLALATSVDALAVGIGYSVIRAPIWAASGIIGVVTFGTCLVGCEFGRRIGARIERWAGMAGGVVLILIGAKILVEHLS